MKEIPIILASASPRRRELLHQFGLRPEVRPQQLDESAVPGESPAGLAARLASAKCRQAVESSSGQDQIFLAADTVVVHRETILGKPRDMDDARRMLELLGGQVHQVLTAVSLHRSGNGAQIDRIRATDVRFRTLDRRWIDWYLATGEPVDKAGAYGIQGRGAVLVDSIRGSWANVVGLPVEMLPEWLAELGVEFLDLAGQPASFP